MNVTHDSKMFVSISMDPEIVRPGLCHPIKKDIPKIKERLRQKLPKLKRNELKKFHEPLHKIILSELITEGYRRSAFYLQSLYRKDKRHYDQATDPTKKFIKSDIILKELGVQLRNVENALKHNSICECVQVLQNLGDFLVDHSKTNEYYWMAEELYLLGLDEAFKVQSTDLQPLAIILYLLGWFYEKSKRYDMANDNLGAARKIVVNKKWMIVEDTKKVILFKALRLRYYKTLLAEAEMLIDSSDAKDKEKSLKLAKLAVEVAIEVDNFDAIGEAHNTYGKYLTKVEKFAEAMEEFKKAQPYYRMIENFKQICVVEIDIADCLKLMKDYKESRKHLNRAIKLAIKDNFQYELALGYEKMGYVEQIANRSKLAANNFVNAVEIYHKLGMEKEMRHSRCLAAVCLAQDLVIPFANVAIKSNGEKFLDNIYMEKLLKWKDRRVPFWDDIDITESIGFSIGSSIDTENENKISLKEASIKEMEVKTIAMESVPESLSFINLMFDRLNASSERAGRFRELHAEILKKKRDSQFL